MAKKNKLFETQYYNLGESITKYYMDNGVGCVAAKISKYNDVISKYSGEGYECLDHEFYSYLDRNLQYIPESVPVLLQIYGCKLNDKQKTSIVENIREHYQFKLGEVIEANKAKLRKIGVFLILAMIFFPLSVITEEKYEMLSNFLNLAFWFYGSSVVTYLAVEVKGAKDARARAGQFANMYITIDEKLNKDPITEKDKEIIYSFIQNMNEKEKTK